MASEIARRPRTTALTGQDEVTHIDQGLDFLGWNVRRQNGKVLVKPSQKNVHAFQPKARETIKANGSAKQAALIRQLNPILRGWANYRRSQAASKTFQHADAQVFAALWRWARRRHPQKGGQWVRQKYWKSEGNRQWVFATRMFEDHEQLVASELVSLAGVEIRRHVKVRADFNPFDPEWAQYAEQRRTAAVSDRLGYRQQVLGLYQRQGGRCAHCGAPITWESGWHDDHIVQRSNAVSDALDNRVLVHPNCHAQVHQALGLLQRGWVMRNIEPPSEPDEIDRKVDIDREVRSFTIKFSMAMVLAVAVGVLIAWLL